MLEYVLDFFRERKESYQDSYFMISLSFNAHNIQIGREPHLCSSVISMKLSSLFNQFS